MRSILPLFFFCAVCLSCSSGNNTENLGVHDLQIFADSLFQSNVDSAMIAGGSVIVRKDGETLVNRSYGFASLELEAGMPENPSFEIGSVTKQFTAAAIVRLAEQGKLSLDDDITNGLVKNKI